MSSGKKTIKSVTWKDLGGKFLFFYFITLFLYKFIFLLITKDELKVNSQFNNYIYLFEFNIILKKMQKNIVELAKAYLL